jgi:hypothetical protein
MTGTCPSGLTDDQMFLADGLGAFTPCVREFCAW